jgi:Type VIII secretion system (T8SS), CsgF protein
MRNKLTQILVLTTAISCASAYATEITQSFKSPSFNGINWSQHVQQIDSTETSRAQGIKDAQAAAAALAKSEAADTPLAKFMALFTSQVYAQLATQLSNNLFAEGTAKAGTFTLDGNSISYVKSDQNVTLTVVDAKGNTTVVTVPIATFGF